MQTLVLNATYEPINFVSAKRAIVLVLQEKAEIITRAAQEFHSEFRKFAVPLVVRLLKVRRIPFQAKVKLSKGALTARDHGLCGYCGKQGQNIDHIIPRSRGGKHIWENVVWACYSCNDRKADHLLSECGMKLLVKPYQPKDKLQLILADKIPDWELYVARASVAQG